MSSYSCEKCGRKWVLTVGSDDKFYFNNSPVGRAASKCYCGSMLGGGGE